MLASLLEALGIEEWEAGDYDDSLICPHGWEIETDGMCPDGCISPLRELGMI